MNPHFASLVLGLAHQAEAALGGNAAARRRGSWATAPPGGPDADRHARHAAGEDRGPARSGRAAAARPGADRAPLPLRADRRPGREPPRRDHRARRARHRRRRTTPPPTATPAATRSATSLARVGGLALPHLEALGLGLLRAAAGRGVRRPAAGRVGHCRAHQRRARTAPPGTGSSAASSSRVPFPTYPRGFPDDVLAEFTERTGRGVLGNTPASGTAGARRLRRGAPADGQVDRLHLGGQRLPGRGARGDGAARGAVRARAPPPARCCRGEHGVSRVIARPFVGAPGAWVRTAQPQGLQPAAAGADAARPARRAPRAARRGREGGRPVRRPRDLQHPHRDQRRGLPPDRERAGARCAAACCSPT